MQVVYPYDTTPFVRISIEEVARTLAEAIVLVFVVMLVFPAVINRARRRPISSVSAWISVVCPPRERPIALLNASLLRMRQSGEP